MSLRLFFLYQQPSTHSFFPCIHTHAHIQRIHCKRIKTGPFSFHVTLALLLASAFSLYILLLLQSPFAIITYTADGHTQSKAELLTHTCTTVVACVCVSCLKKKREEKAKTYVHTYRYIYIYIYMYLYVYTSCASVFFRCRFLL